MTQLYSIIDYIHGFPYCLQCQHNIYWQLGIYCIEVRIMAATHTDGFPTTSAEKCLDYGVEKLEESEPSNLTDNAPCDGATAEYSHDQQAKY